MTATHKTTGASEKAETERKDAAREKDHRDLDDALEDSFPASDPPSMTQPKTKAGGPKRKKDEAPGR